jgi:signal transduction histidine kinase
MSEYIDFIRPLLDGIAIPMLTEHIENESAQKEQELTGAQSQFVYPIMVDGKLWGCFDVDDCHAPRTWSPTEIDSLRLVASAVASVVKREQLVEARIAAEREKVQAAKRQSELLAAVVTTSEFLLKSSSLIDSVDQVLVQMGTALNADRCLLGVMLPPDDIEVYGYLDLRYEWVATGIARQTGHAEQMPMPASLYLDVYAIISAGVPHQILSDEFENYDARQEQELAGSKSQFAYPIMVDGKLWGTFGVDDCHQRRIWSPTEIDSLRLVASAVASVVKREQLVEARIAAERERESARLAGEMAVTNERNRIARDIHDTLAQGFTGVIMQSQAAEDALQKQDAGAVMHHLNRAQYIAQASLHEARRSVFALRPSVLIDQTLAQALKAQLERMAADSTIQTTMSESGEPLEPSNMVATELLRIAQEATTNALRHAKASHITIELHWHAGKVELTIADDGIGFVVEQDRPGFGLVSMRERAARMRAQLLIESRFAQGTVVQVSVDPRAGENSNESLVHNLGQSI